jgi:hypothetical protein
MYKKNGKCHCYKPVSWRPNLIRDGAGDECYAESYIKCFWGLCDHQKSVDSFTNKADTKGINQRIL